MGESTEEKIKRQLKDIVVLPGAKRPLRAELYFGAYRVVDKNGKPAVGARGETCGLVLYRRLAEAVIARENKTEGATLGHLASLSPS